MSQSDDQGRPEPTPTHGRRATTEPATYGRPTAGQPALRPSAPVRPAQPCGQPARTASRSTGSRSTPHVRPQPQYGQPQYGQQPYGGLRAAAGQYGRSTASRLRARTASTAGPPSRPAARTSSSRRSSGSSSPPSACSRRSGRLPRRAAVVAAPASTPHGRPHPAASAPSPRRHRRRARRRRAVCLAWTVLMIWGSVWALTGRSRVLLLVGGSIASLVTFIGVLASLCDRHRTGGRRDRVHPALLPGGPRDRRACCACERLGGVLRRPPRPPRSLTAGHQAGRCGSPHGLCRGPKLRHRSASRRNGRLGGSRPCPAPPPGPTRTTRRGVPAGSARLERPSPAARPGLRRRRATTPAGLRPRAGLLRRAPAPAGQRPAHGDRRRASSASSGAASGCSSACSAC